MTEISAIENTVFISYAHIDRPRIKPIVSYLTESGLSIWMDEKIGAGSFYRLAIQEALDKAACAIVFWTNNSIKSDFVWDEVERAKNRGVLIPVKLDEKAEIPLGFGQMQYIDLLGQVTPSSPGFKKLLNTIKETIAMPTKQLGNLGTLHENSWTIPNADYATTTIKALVSQIGDFSNAVLLDNEFNQDIRGALIEVEKTYKAVLQAIEYFIEPAIDIDHLNVKSYSKLAGRSLQADIRNGRGHCKRVLAYYVKFGGLREKLIDEMDPKDLEEIDDIFGRLGAADGDLFEMLEEVGGVLTNESRVIVGLLASGQDKLARERILSAREKLRDLEDRLDEAMAELQQLQESLGFAN